MSKYSYKCSNCDRIVQQYNSKRVQQIVCKSCGKTMLRQMPTIHETQVEETVNKMTNTRWKKDQKEMVQERKQDYYWKQVVPRLVETHELQTILENEWGYIDDNGQLKIYDKPPHKR